MAQINDAPPSAANTQNSGWTGYTFYGQTGVIPSGDTVTRLEVHSLTAGTGYFKIGVQSGGSINTVFSSPLVSWSTTGWQGADISFQTTAASRFGLHITSGLVTRSTESGRALKDWNGTGNASTGSPVGSTAYFIDGAGMPTLRAFTGGGSPPPPPPPSGLTVAMPGQSNMGNLVDQAGALLSMRFQAVTGQSITLLNLAHDGSWIDLWAPGQPFRTELMAANASAICWGQFEGDASQADKAISWGAKLRSIIEEYRTLHGPVPAFVLYPFDNTNNRPYWWDVARAAELLCDGRYGLPDCTLIRNGRLKGTIDAGIHLDQQRLESWALDVADALALRLVPTAEIIRAP